MAKRILTKTVDSWEEIDQILKEIAILQSQIEEEVARYNQEEQERRAKLTERHAPMKARIQELEQILEEFAMRHRQDFGEKRRRELRHGILSFRLHPPSVERLKNMTWNAVLDLVRTSPWAERFIRTKEELNKDAIIASYGNKEIIPEELARLGMVVVQKESFGYEVKLSTKEE